MKSKKVHLSILKDDLWVKCCDTRKYAFYEFTKDITKVTCKSCLKTKYYHEQVQKMESERKASCEELGIKTQLEIDRIKYNLSKEQVEILSKVDYEVVDGKLDSCDNCLLEYASNDCDDDAPCTKRNGDLIFKQIHKTQESLNEAIENEEVKKGIEEPFMSDIDKLKEEVQEIIYNSTGGTIEIEPPKYNPDDVAFKKSKQESEHYQNGLETIQKIKSTLDNLEGEITLFQAYCMGNIIKYEDRAGLKDDKDKDLYKASDYTAMMINNNWIGND